MTTLVLIGSFIAANLRASLATESVTPSISNITLPGLTLAAQKSTDPLPLPIRTSVGLDVTGRSGKTLIQTLPYRFICRVMARLAASICRAVIRSGSVAFNP